ncbi:hypothetical protein GK047_17950 [Paenibacillus sp. SYP-B3998]|uniref:Uncharacterized protein n=1 Tax=Paenibacillus sp. SYP-B3998 TaxID=2678564 RepID=A0A6G4A0I7_9BACL|nr:hypothetical protein [Paenibacillus sp. SYP-B3998]NEW07885.1 hypothetical protein [Paenibacillus sp. SYP-B3998]
MGSGTGRFAYHFLTYLSRIYESTSLKYLDFCYILNDLPTENLEFWRCHPNLEPFVEKENLDFAVFDVENDTVIHLIHNKTTINPQSLFHPLILIANYFFDIFLTICLISTKGISSNLMYFFLPLDYVVLSA